MTLGRVMDEVRAEADRAGSRFGDFRSTHEGLGVLVEEVAELVEAIRRNDRREVKREAIQVSAVAARIADSLCNVHTVDRSGMEAE